MSSAEAPVPSAPPRTGPGVLGWIFCVLLLAIVAASLRYSLTMADTVNAMLPANIGDSDGESYAVLYLSVFLPMLAAAALFALIDRQGLWRIGEQPLTTGGSAFLYGSLGITAALGMAILANNAAPGIGGSTTAALFLAGAALVLFQAATEEVVFRGFIQPRLSSALGPVAAITITAIAFSLLHMMGVARSPVAILNLALGGIWFGILAWRTGGLLAPVLAHFGWNATEQLALGIDPNPGVGVMGSVLNYDLAGVALWGGSEEGINGSIAMSLVLVALIVPLVWRRPAIAPDAPAPRLSDPVPA